MSDTPPLVKNQRLWHGGPKIGGHLILPPERTRVWSTADIFDQLPDRDDHDPSIGDPSWVYCINQRWAALLFAAAHPDPWLYEVKAFGALELDPDYRHDPTKDVWSFRAHELRIMRREKPSNYEVQQARSVLRQLFKKDSP